MLIYPHVIRDAPLTEATQLYDTPIISTPVSRLACRKYPSRRSGFIESSTFSISTRPTRCQGGFLISEACYHTLHRLQETILRDKKREGRQIYSAASGLAALQKEGSDRNQNNDKIDNGLHENGSGTLNIRQ